MANVKTILDTRRAKSDGTFNVIFRITHFKKIYTINSGVSVYDMYWDNSIRRISIAHFIFRIKMKRAIIEKEYRGTKVPVIPKH